MNKKIYNVIAGEIKKSLAEHGKKLKGVKLSDVVFEVWIAMANENLHNAVFSTLSCMEEDYLQGVK